MYGSTENCCMSTRLCNNYLLIWDQTLRQVFWDVIIESKYGLKEKTAFEFKYIPELGKGTALEKRGRISGTNNGSQRRNLRTFVIGSVALTLGIIVAWKTLALCVVSVPVTLHFLKSLIVQTI